MAVGTEKQNLGKIRWTNNFLLSQRTYNGLKWAKMGAEAWHEWLTPAMLYAFTDEYIFGEDHVRKVTLRNVRLNKFWFLDDFGQI